MIQAKGIFKSFGSVELLKDVNLQIAPNEVVSIVGASGAGKTSLLQILGTLDTPDKGEVKINGVNPFQLKQKELAAFRNTHIGFVFQFHNLLAEFNALENVCIPALIGGVPKAEAEARAKMWLERLGLEKRIFHKPAEMSGGEQQRVAVARALINNPKVVFADEPSGNLDKSNATSLHQLFFELRSEFNHCFVIVTHNEELAEMADRKIVMSDGKVI